MGNRVSFSRSVLVNHTPKASPSPDAIRLDSLLCSFDASGTLYRFKRPIAQQYLDVARRCGMKAYVSPLAIEKAFGDAYKRLNQQYPNYGKRTLSGPEEWWGLLTDQTFAQATNGSHVPPHLSSELYQHFSSGAAYELYPEIKQMFIRLREARQNFVRCETLMESIRGWYIRPIVGVITNSDPRVAGILRDLGLKVGATESQRVEDGTSIPPMFGGPKVVEADWNPDNDIDYVCTSYEAGSEKPAGGIFQHAQTLTDAVFQARYQQLFTRWKEEASTTDMMRLVQPHMVLYWDHFGDDLEKDFKGARSWGVRTSWYVKRREKGPATKEEKFETKGGEYILPDLSTVLHKALTR